MSSGAHRGFRGTYTGTGALLNETKIGFRPNRVTLYNTAGDSAYWQDSMADDSMYKRAVAGAGSFVTAAAITPLANGFSIGADADLNVVGQIVHYIAEG